ncbi:MAG: inorganic phosphate transporter [Bacilli bacterium]|nr:inorganic phosphate transporter [Bacilli bacterium]
MKFNEFIEIILSNKLLLIIFILISIVILINGATDAANSVISGVTTKTMSFNKAIIISSIFNLLGVIVITTINNKVVVTIFNIAMFKGNDALLALFTALISIIIWTSIAWYFGIPTSESHALIAGITGSAIAFNNGFNCINFNSWLKVILGLLISISLGILGGYVLYIIRKKTSKKIIYCSTAFISFMHGAQDGQKFIGLYLLVLLTNSTNKINVSIPIWLMLFSSLLMGIGTLIGGKRIVKKMGNELVELDLKQCTSSDYATSLVLLLSTLLGIPISTTHVKMTSLIGVGLAKKTKINISVIKQLIFTWILTFPGCGLISFILTKFILK